MTKTTRWSKNKDYELWECNNCDIAWEFSYDGPEENEVNYCPKCGLKIVEFVREAKS